MFEPRKQLFPGGRVQTFEIGVAIIIFCVACWLSPNEADPLLLRNSHIIFPLSLFSFIALYYGMGMVLFFFGAYAVITHFNYDITPYRSLLFIVLLSLLCSQFHFLWCRQLRAYKEQLLYLQQRLRELSYSFFTLRTAYDQIASAYLFSPVTISVLLQELLEKNTNESELIDDFLRLTHRHFNIDEASIYLHEGNHGFRLRGSIGDEPIYWDKNNPLIKHFLKHSENASVADLQDSEQADSILAVIAILDSSERIRGALLIGKTPFLDLNLDKLQKLEVLTNYLFQELDRQALHMKAATAYPFLPESIRTETYRLAVLEKAYNVNSMLVIIKTRDDTDRINVQRFVDRGLRILDQYGFSANGEFSFFWFLLPFENKSGADGFLERVISFSQLTEDNDTQLLSVSLDRLTDVRKWIAPLKTKT